MRNLALLVVPIVLAAAGCATVRPVDTWTAENCHRATAPFARYAVELADVPGFKQPIMRDALDAALQRRGLLPAADADADVIVRLEIALRQPDADGARPGDWTDGEDDAAGPNPLEAAARDPITPSTASDPTARFLAQAVLRARERDTDREIWSGTMARSHAISGAEPFHGQRATLLIAEALDRLLVGLDTPCEAAD